MLVSVTNDECPEGTGEGEGGPRGEGARDWNCGFCDAVDLRSFVDIGCVGSSLESCGGGNKGGPGFRVGSGRAFIGALTGTFVFSSGNELVLRALFDSF